MRRFVALMLFLASFAVGFAADHAPDALVKSVTDEVLAVIRGGDDRDPAGIARLVETKVLPHFDFARMTRLAMGRNWRLASPQQQKALITQFKDLLVRTYSTSLTLYRDQKIEFAPLRAAPGDVEVSVSCLIRKAGREPISIDYAMEKGPAGWKVYDVRIDGISLVINYRSTFANQVRQHGVDGLIQLLEDKNRANEGPAGRDGARSGIQRRGDAT